MVESVSVPAAISVSAEADTADAADAAFAADTGLFTLCCAEVAATPAAPAAPVVSEAIDAVAPEGSALNSFNLSALVTTQTLERLMAAAANMGDSFQSRRL